MNEINQDKLLGLFVDIGFTKEEALSQLKELIEIIDIKIYQEIMQDEDGSTQSPEELQNKLKEKLKDDKYKKQVVEIIQSVTSIYLNEITQDLEPAKKEKFIAGLSNLMPAE